ncbi:MAG: MOSC domain-containing protein [Deltaproteobacteria bacterium]|nr:MOSC domain-containing protein [Deltaproteobacteria bacterium]
MRISSLTQYPIKSCAGMALERAEIDASGLRGDRLLFLIDESGEALSQEELPRMALIQPSLVGSDLVVVAPEADPLELVVVERGESRHTRHWEDEAPAIDQGDAAARWFSEFLDTPCRLMASGEIHERPVPEKYRHIFPAEQSRFTAVAPILLTSEASLADFNGRVKKPIRMNRFRPNLVVEGSAPFHEEWWARLRIGDLELEKVASSERCGVTQLNQETGERGIEPIRTLAKYRRQPGGVDGGIVFGVYFRPVAPGALNLGDEVSVLETQDRFVPNDRAAKIAEEDMPVPPSDL